MAKRTFLMHVASRITHHASRFTHPPSLCYGAARHVSRSLPHGHFGIAGGHFFRGALGEEEDAFEEVGGAVELGVAGIADPFTSRGCV